LLLIAIVIVLIRLHVFRDNRLNSEPWRDAIGLALFAAGLGFAIWARVHIGRNWGHPMSQKEDPELVTSGPYRYVRHPIYSGIILAGVGTAVGLGWPVLLAVGLAAIYFSYSATVEERFMTEQFPETYPAYRSTTKMLVPFVL
jgi:protein-S-isoprenylcysteine O-methyltransferase Ste14